MLTNCSLLTTEHFMINYADSEITKQKTHNKLLTFKEVQHISLDFAIKNTIYQN